MFEELNFEMKVKDKGVGVKNQCLIQGICYDTEYLLKKSVYDTHAVSNTARVSGEKISVYDTVCLIYRVSGEKFSV